MKKFTMIAALLCASLLSFAIDWSGYQWLDDGAGGGAYSNKYKVAPAEGQNVVNIQQPGWAAEPGIYTSDFGGAITSCSLGDKCAIDGGGIVLYLSAFTQQETEVTVVAALGSKTFTVYYADGTTGGGSGSGDSEPTEVYDTNFALASNGATASAKSGNEASLANDGNSGTRWWSETADMTDEQKNDQWWQVDLGQRRIFNTIQIEWEGAWGKSFDIQISDDAETWTTVKQIRDQNIPGPFPYLQTIELDAKKTARYVRFQGVARGTGYAYSFWEFRVLLPGTSVLTTINLSSAAAIAAVNGAGVALTPTPKNQNGEAMEAEISYEITPEDAGHMNGNMYVPDKLGNAEIVAYSGEVRSAAVTVFGYTGSELAMNKEVEVSGYDTLANLYPRFAVDPDEGSLWSAVHGETGAVREYDAWIIVDLEAYYDISLLAIRWEGACSKHYHVDFSADKTNWRTAYNAGWNATATHWEYLYGTAEDATKVRYVRVWSTEAQSQYGIKIMALRVYGEEWTPSGDTEAPVMVSATLDSKTWNSAVIAVSATDNMEVAKYHVVDASKDINEKCLAADGKITVTGLAAATAYNFTITAIDVANNESANSIAVAVTTNERHIVPTVAAPVPTWPAAQVKSIYSDAYDFAPASLIGYNQDWWNNPNMTQEEISGNHYLHYDLYRSGMIGAQFGEISILNMEKVHIDIYASAAGSITFRPITIEGPNTPKALALSAEQWNSFDIALTEFAGHDWSKLYQFAIEGYEAGGLVGEHICVDNIYFYRETALADTEAPTNVAAAKASESYFSVVLTASAQDNSGSVSFVVKNGETEVATGAGASGANVNITVPNLTPNTDYNFSVIAKDDAGNAAEPVAVSVKTLVAPASAPAITMDAENLKVLYADGFEAATTGFDYRQNWWNGASLVQGKLTENDNVLFYIPQADGGSHGWAFTPFDATDFVKLHVSIYPIAAGTFRIYPVVSGQDEASYYRSPEADLVAGEWNELVFDFSDLVLNPMGQIGWNSYYALGGFFIDNVYFYKPTAATAVEAVENATVATKFIQNGTLYILRDDKMFTIQGVRVR